MWVLAGAIPFFYLAAGTENEWIDGLADNGTGAVFVTAGLWGIFLVLFLAAMLWRFPRGRGAAVGGWLLSLLPAGGLVFWGYSVLQCSGCVY
jgi:hypothetical protein